MWECREVLKSSFILNAVKLHVLDLPITDAEGQLNSFHWWLCLLCCKGVDVGINTMMSEHALNDVIGNLHVGIRSVLECFKAVSIRPL